MSVFVLTKGSVFLPVSESIFSFYDSPSPPLRYESIESFGIDLTPSLCYSNFFDKNGGKRLSSVRFYFGEGRKSERGLMGGGRVKFYTIQDCRGVSLRGVKRYHS